MARPQLDVPRGTRVRRARVDEDGRPTLRRAGKLHHNGLCKAHRLSADSRANGAGRWQACGHALRGLFRPDRRVSMKPDQH